MLSLSCKLKCWHACARLDAARSQFYLAFFYILVCLMCASVGLCVYVAICFKSGSFPYVWPVKCVRPLRSLAHPGNPF